MQIDKHDRRPARLPHLRKYRSRSGIQAPIAIRPTAPMHMAMEERREAPAVARQKAPQEYNNAWLEGMRQHEPAEPAPPVQRSKR